MAAGTLYRARRRKKYKKKKRTSFRKGSTIISKFPSPLGKTHKAKLRYYEKGLTLDSSGGGVSTAFSANGVYDPYTPIGGHQPVGFDELMAMYDHCVVIGSKITVQFSTIETTYAQAIAINVQDSSTIGTDIRVLVENGMMALSQLGPRDSGTGTKTITMKCNPNKFLGRKDPLSDPDLKNSASANPNEQAFYVVYVEPIGGTDTNIVYFNVLIEYDCIFIEPKQLALS